MSEWKNVQYKDGKMKTSEGGGGSSSTFSGLEDVSLTNLQNGQVPKYNSNTQKWENEENSLANLSDTSMLTLSDKQVLSYNARTQKWENKSNSVSRLSDVSLNNPSDGDILRYNAQNDKWTNTSMPNIYGEFSTTEQEVGVWIDGKSIYRKVFNCNVTLQNTNWYNTNVIFNGVDTVISGSAIDTDKQSWCCALGMYRGTNDTIGILLPAIHTGGVNIKKIIIQYTKTTD